MGNSPAVKASRNFLETVWEGDPPTVSALTAVLDRLLASYHDTPNTKAPYYELDPPEKDWKSIYDHACIRFPQFGFYPVADPTELGDGAVMMGDAIDDIADITNDLRITVWYADNHSEEYADAYFRHLFFHWGQHARELLLLLHASQFR